MTPTQLGEALAAADARADAGAIAALAAASAAESFADRQMELLRGPPAAELQEHVGKRHGEVREAVARSAERILKSVYRVSTIDALAALGAREILVRALAERYRPLSPARPYLTFVGTVRIRDDLEYGVFEEAMRGLLPEALERPGIRRPKAMTFVRTHDEWHALLDGALPFEALRVFAPA